MDDNENKPQNDKALLSSSALEYLFKRLLALETRIELLEEKNAVSPQKENDLLLKADSIEKKLDMLIGQIRNIPMADAIEDIGGSQTAGQSKLVPQVPVVKKSVAVFIDGENISHKKAEKIIEKSSNRGQIEFACVYGVQNNNSDKCWAKTSGKMNIKHIRLAGGSKKNKVDNKMFEEILNEAKKPNHADTIVIATNDADFVPVVNEVKGMGVRVVIMGLESSLSDKMKKACDSFVYL